MEKACIQFLTVEEGDREEVGTIEVDFNPTELNISTVAEEVQKKQNFQTGKNGPEKNTYTYANYIEKTTVSVRLVFDGDEVEKKAEVFLAAARNPMKRILSFNWDEIFFEGILENVITEYTMFDTAGNPRRANVDITIECEEI